MKIAIVVHGRFHGFDLARALLARGHDVTVLTNYPRWAAARFGLPPSAVRSFVTHGVLTRAASRLGPARAGGMAEGWSHRLFGRWAATELARGEWDVVHCWSGVSEELLQARGPGVALTLLMRGSAHIVVQSQLLEEEARRTGASLDRPSAWMIERERREYALADRIVVLSTFARRTFEAQGIPASRLSLLPLGVDVQAFRPSPDVIDARAGRMRSGQPLTVLYVGALSYQKGLFDLAKVIAQAGTDRFRFVLAGPETPEAAGALAALRGQATLLGKLPQRELPRVYHDADLFLFPTIQDGFGVVLPQAKAAGLPVITTDHSAASDVVTAGRDGWIVPIRDSAAIVDRLRWCDGHREPLAAMTRAVYEDFRPRDWADVALDFETLCAPASEWAPSMSGPHGR